MQKKKKKMKEGPRKKKVLFFFLKEDFFSGVHMEYSIAVANMDRGTDKIPSEFEEKSHKKHEIIKPLASSWKLISVVILALIYGSSLLLSQINSLYENHHSIKEHRKHDIESLSSLTTEDIDDVHIDSRIPLSFSDIKSGIFVPESKQIQWIQTPTSQTNDSGDYIVIENGNYILKSLKDESSSQVLFDLGQQIEYNNETFGIETITFSDDLKIALLTCNKRHNWRHSFFATYFIFNTETKNIQLLVEGGVNANNDIALAKISPDSLKIAYVLYNNVFIKDITDFFNPITRQVTFDGSEQIFNGKPDWVYEEEVFESDSALWWSPDSNHLVILHSNDTEVPTFPIPYFVQELNQTAAYPKLTEIKYPKAGYSNPVVDILIYDVSQDYLKKLPNKDVFYNDNEINNLDRLITEVVWVGNNQVLVKVTNRESDIMKIFIVECGNSELNSIVSRFEDGRGNKSWFEISHNTIFIPKSANRLDDGYIDLVDVDGYDHLAYFSPANSSRPKAYLTRGEWEVVNGAAAFDFVNDKVYYVSTEKSSIERHLYSTSLDGEVKETITDVSAESWFDVSFSKGSRYLLLSYQGPGLPYQSLLDLHENKSVSFSDNDQLARKLENYNLPEIRYGNITLKDNLTLNYKETLPLNFDPSKKYPLLFFVYGGPGSQLVNKLFSVSFSSAIASELNAVVVTVDGRGTGFKGKKFRNIVRDHLGYYEVLDQISAAQYWIEKKGYIDADRTAIWGWSYGGFMTLKTLSYDSGNTFKYGMSVAPVTDWRFYDSVYTERYLHTPQQNPEGYTDSSVHLIDNLKGCNRFLLMHGTGDDNVHFQNSLQFIDSLDLHNVENYDMYVFPDSDHSIRWHNAGTVVYDRLFTWLKRAFEGEFKNIRQPETMGVDQEFFIDLYG